jgi:quercetin dioxygenase-like cupin family protein
MGPKNIDDLDLAEVGAVDDDAVRWSGDYFAYGGGGSERSATVYFTIPPGKRLGRHTDTAEEIQFILSGSGVLRLDDGDRPIRAGDVAVLEIGVAHDLVNEGSDDLRVVGFFAAPQVEQHWDEPIDADGSKVTGTPNRG